jgi:hypothetical protein
MVSHAYLVRSPRTIARRWKEMGVAASRHAEPALAPGKIVQLVADQMAMDPSAQVGKNGMKQKIALETGYHLKRYGQYLYNLYANVLMYYG